MQIRTALVAAVAGVVLATTAGCPAQPSDPSAVEVEDCDAEDRRNNEPDCGGVPAPTTKGATTKTPKPKTTKKR